VATRSERFFDGAIVEYPYLWGWQRDQNQLEGDKSRPACLAAVIYDARQDIHHLVILAISATPPKSGQRAIEIPELELRRAGLDAFKRGWIAVSEYNYDVLERSYYFEPGRQPRGSFTKVFTRRVADALRPLLVARAGRIDRSV
jgi:hypothetical protein